MEIQRIWSLPSDLPQCSIQIGSRQLPLAPCFREGPSSLVFNHGQPPATDPAAAGPNAMAAISGARSLRLQDHRSGDLHPSAIPALPFVGSASRPTSVLSFPRRPRLRRAAKSLTSPRLELVSAERQQQQGTRQDGGRPSKLPQGPAFCSDPHAQPSPSSLTPSSAGPGARPASRRTSRSPRAIAVLLCFALLFPLFFRETSRASARLSASSEHEALAVTCHASRAAQPTGCPRPSVAPAQPCTGRPNGYLALSAVSC